MALINCPECGKEISDNAAICPECGNPIKQQKSKQKIILPFIIIITLIAVITGILSYYISNYVSNKAVDPEEYLIGLWEVTLLTLDGEMVFSPEQFESMGYSVGGELLVTPTTFSLTLGEVNDIGTWNLNKEDESYYDYTLTSEDGIYFVQMDKTNVNEINLGLSLGDDRMIMFILSKEEP